jgi:hypothetical protein
MDELLGQLDLLKKPVPKKKGKIGIKMRPRGAVEVNVEIVDKSGDEVDRVALLAKVYTAAVVKIPRRRQETPVAVPKSSADQLASIINRKSSADDVEFEEKREKITLPRSKVVVKRKRGNVIRIGKSIRKGTITGLAPTVINITGTRKKAKIKRDLGTVESRDRGDVPSELIQIGDTIIAERLANQEASVNIRASSYYLNNREIFINFINSLFEPYRAALIEESKDVSCDKPKGSFSLMTHQQIVRDYINMFTPYRGLLLYHGLGAGKTCASIGIAEGLKTTQPIIIMTPASLRQNYISELTVCGDPLYRLNQFWEFISTGGDSKVARVLSQAMGLSEEYIRKKGGAWLVNIKKPSNFDGLSTTDKLALNEQIDRMIKTKYIFINYNGLRKSDKVLGDLQGLSKTNNPFDNKVVIVDEAHNFVSRIVNKIKKPTSLSYMMYEWLMSAENCRIIFLTGTPIINYPNEMGVMFNMLRGYIKTFIFTVNVQTSEVVNQETIENIFKIFALHDFIEYDNASKRIVITRNPFGFVNVSDQGVYSGIKKNKGNNKCDKKKKGRDCERGYTCENTARDGEEEDFRCTPMSDEAFVNICRDILRKNGIDTMGVQVKLNKALPDTLDTFNAMFVNPKTGEIKNENLLQRRILGLTSYFRSAQEELMPRFNIEEDFRVVDIPMSDYQFGLYKEARENERVLETRNAKKRRMAQNGGVYADTVSTYRIFSRAFCNFVFPRDIIRPMKQEGQGLQDAILDPGLDEDDMDAVSIQEKIANVDGRFEADDESALESVSNQAVETSYGARIKQALVDLEARSGEFLTPKKLEIYSPKFLEVLKNITSNERKLHLVYSQFRTLEGIGIFSIVLEANGYTNFKLKKVAGIWKLDIPEEKLDLPKYALFTGTESVEEKEILRNIYNGMWDKIPGGIRDYLLTKSPNNNHGEIISVFMITSSGAEGITLKNTRMVHIMEPYWHPVRVEQVIGRARRICSHNKLEEDERDVKVFMYLMKFTEEQLVPESAGGMAPKELLEKDVSKINSQIPLTSDQHLYEVSNIKESINKQILGAIKGSSIDCSLHSSDKDKFTCMSFGSVASSRFTTTPALTTEAEYDVQERRNLKKIEWEAEIVTLGGMQYALKRFNTQLPARKAPEGELYDLQSYKRAQKVGGDPVLVGYLRIDRRSGKLKKTRV